MQDLEDPMRALAMLPKDSEVYKMKMQHLKEITRLKHEIERVTQEQRLERIRLDAEQERNEGKAEAEHLAWVNEQRRRVRCASPPLLPLPAPPPRPATSLPVLVATHLRRYLAWL